MGTILRAASAAIFMSALTACAGLSELVGQYAGEEGLGLLQKAAEGAETIEDATLGNAMKALPVYCKVPGAARGVFRARANDRPEAEGNMIAVWCVGDDPLTLGE